MKIALDKNRSKEGVNKDLYIPISFNIKESMAVDNSLSETINSYKQFEDERNACNKYNLNITIKPYLTNILCDALTVIKDKTENREVDDEDERIALIQDINSVDYDYKLGYDIFDNSFERLDTFKTGSTITGFTGATLFDLMTIEESIRKNLIYDDGWLCIENKCKIGGSKMFPDKNPYEKIDLFPTRDYFSIKPNIVDGVEVYNWSIILTYPHSSDNTNKLVVDNGGGITGIPIYSSYSKNVYGRNYIFIKSPYKHGLKSGDIIKIHSTNKTYLVNEIGDEKGDSVEYIFSIDTDKYKDVKPDSIKNSRFSRVINGVSSIYYLRKFKRLPKSTFENYEPAFSQTIYGEKLFQIQNTEDLDVSELRDNRGRPISEIYVTIVKNTKDCNTGYDFHNSFSSVSSGIDMPITTSGYTNVRLMDGPATTEPQLESSITGTTQELFYGDISEYNAYTAKETMLDEVTHRFNTTKRDVGGTFIHHTIGENNEYIKMYGEINPRNEGYIYKPHYKVKIKNYSKVLSTDKLFELKANTAPVSGITTSGLVNLLSNMTDNDIAYVIVVSDNFYLADSLNKIRVTRKVDNEYYISHSYVQNANFKLIAIEYDVQFMGAISGFTHSNYTYKVHGSSLIPDYAQDRYNGTCAWREMLAEGVFDSESDIKSEHVFSNGRFYIGQSINLYLKRQDPNGKYNLKASEFPMDYSSLSIETPIEDKKIKLTNNRC